jgi:hypothetical protein
MTSSKRRNHTAPTTLRPPTRSAHLKDVPTLGRVAEGIQGHLATRRADHTSLPDLLAALDTDIATIKATVARYPSLGIAGARERPVVYCVNPAVLAAGFHPVLSNRRMILRLATPGGPPWPLTVSGAHLGTAPQYHDLDMEQLDGRYGRGELGYTIARLTLMARRWLIVGRPPTQRELTTRLFELIARAWEASPGPAWVSGRLHVHQVELDLPVGTRFWQDDTPTSRLELVVWADKQSGFQLVNVYPAGTYRSIFGTEET